MSRERFAGPIPIRRPRISLAGRKPSQNFNAIFVENYSPMRAAGKKESAEKGEKTHRKQSKWGRGVVHEASYVQKTKSHNEAERSHGERIKCTPGASIYRVGTRKLFQAHGAKIPYFRSSHILMSRVTGHLDFGTVENLRTGKTIVRARLRPQIQVVRNPTSERQTDQKPKSPPPILSDSHDQHDRPSTRQEQTEPQTKIASGNRNGKSTYGRTRQRSDKQRPES